MVGDLPRIEVFESMSMPINATFVGLAPLATKSSTAASTRLSADQGEGVRTGENEGESLVMDNISSLPALLIDCALVRTESFPPLGKYQLLSFKECFQRVPVKGVGLRLAVSAIFKFWCSFRNASVEGLLEWRLIIEKDAFLPPTLAFILRRTFVKDRGERGWKTTPNILV